MASTTKTATSNQDSLDWSDYFGMIYSGSKGLVKEFKSAVSRESERLTVDDIPVDVRESIEMNLAMDGQIDVSDGRIVAIYRDRKTSEVKT